MKLLMKFVSYGVIFTSILLISSCVHTLNHSNFNNAEYKIPDKFRNNSEISSINGNKEKSSYKDPVKEITNMLQDNTFKEIVENIVAENPDLLILMSKVNVARSKIRTSTANLFPSVSGSVKYGKSENKDNIDGDLSFKWELDIYGKMDALRKSDAEMIKYSQNNLINGQVTILSDVAKYYFSIRKSANQLILADNMLQNYKNILDVYEEMRKVGLVDETSYIETTSDYLRAENNVQQYKLEIEKNKNALIALMNNKVLNFEELKEYNIDFKPNIPEINTIPSKVLLNRPDIRSGIYSLNSELYVLYNREMSLYPTLSINGSIGQLLASSTGPGDFVWQIGASLFAPLLNRQELYTALKNQKESVAQADLNLRKSINTAISEIETATFGMDSSNKTFETTKEILFYSYEAFKILEMNFKNGLVDEISYLQGKNNYLTAKSNFLNTWFENINSSITLYKSFGGSFSVPNDDYSLEKMADTQVKEYNKKRKILEKEKKKNRINKKLKNKENNNLNNRDNKNKDKTNNEITFLNHKEVEDKNLENKTNNNKEINSKIEINSKEKTNTTYKKLWQVD